MNPFEETAKQNKKEAAFIRIKDVKNPLDNSAVHHENSKHSKHT
jgi:transcriptional accessory protein Tex/SPT6